MKLARRLLIDESNIWTQILKSKYKFNPSTSSFDYVANLSFCQWVGIRLGLKLLNKGVMWRLGSGKKVSFWFDNWCNDKVLQGYIGDNISWNIKVFNML